MVFKNLSMVTLFILFLKLAALWYYHVPTIIWRILFLIIIIHHSGHSESMCCIWSNFQRLTWHSIIILFINQIKWISCLITWQSLRLILEAHGLSFGLTLSLTSSKHTFLYIIFPITLFLFILIINPFFCFLLTPIINMFIWIAVYGCLYFIFPIFSLTSSKHPWRNIIKLTCFLWWSAWCAHWISLIVEIIWFNMLNHIIIVFTIFLQIWFWLYLLSLEILIIHRVWCCFFILFKLLRTHIKRTILILFEGRLNTV